VSLAVLPGSGASSGPGSTGTARRRRRILLALTALGVLAAAGGIGAAAVASDGDGEQSVTVRTADGQLIAQVPLEGDTFAVGYRNSIYGTLAEERYRVHEDGRFELVEIAAEQLAVLEEYYQVPDAPRPAPPGDRLAYVVEPDPARPAVFAELNIAATDLGERTLWVPGHPAVPVWQRVVSDDPTVLLDIEETE
jgi:hypothetical protein